ncbi:hypothetical protein [Mesomycoplasma lagogenitalium]|uniref:Uncharacterized protein n=1 Tax=Mesomycoplasma lagogenitalium TaxID=171286 RepID=A0ABY8LUT6_9BACT|nr:hypothetical protein [Mesomycoplasma lagogenitalium]WGI37015.1 hypothetical protein QEG99_01885 [Mesomycoplasma lagogenitalium]
MKKEYTIDELKVIFKKVFEIKSRKEEEEKLSCGFKKSFYHFKSYNQKTKIINYIASESDDPNNENVFFYNMEISIDDLLKMENE